MKFYKWIFSLALFLFFHNEIVSASPLSGTVSFDNCSGSVIRFIGQSKNQNAVVLSSGHCLDFDGEMMGPDSVIFNSPTKTKVEIYNNKEELIPFTANKILYATMSGTDLLLMQLNVTYAQLEKLGIYFFELSNKEALVGSELQIPSGLWRQIYNCKFDKVVNHLKESEYNWFETIRFDEGCKVESGSSGSPVVLANTKVVLGTNSTGNDFGGECTVDAPCEVDANGKIEVLLRNYGMQTHKIYSCLSDRYKLDLQKKGCALPAPK